MGGTIVSLFHMLKLPVGPSVHCKYLSFLHISLLLLAINSFINMSLTIHFCVLNREFLLRAKFSLPSAVHKNVGTFVGFLSVDAS